LSLLAFLAPLVVAGAAFGIGDALIAPILRVKSGPAAIAQIAARVVHHVPGLHDVSAYPFDALLSVAIVALTVIATWRILAGHDPFAALLWLFVAIWLLAGKVESWYALTVTPLVIGGSRAGVSLFIGLTCASTLMVAGPLLNEFPYSAMFGSAVLLTLVTFAALTTLEPTTRRRGASDAQPT
jgi:hypothetical protein